MRPPGIDTARAACPLNARLFNVTSTPPWAAFVAFVTSRVILGEVVLVVAVLPVCVSVGGCGKPFNVRPRQEVSLPAPPARSAAGAVSVAAEAVTDEDRLYDTFDANLILAGVLAVRVRLTNTGPEPVDLRKASFELRTGGAKFRPADWKRAYQRLMSYYGVSTYSKSGYKQSRDDFASHALDTSTPIGSGTFREGLVFFLVPEEIARAGGLRLAVTHLIKGESKTGGSIELTLD